MIDKKEILVYDYWARFTFLRFNDSIEYPIMDILISELGKDSIDTITNIFVKTILFNLDVDFFLERVRVFIQSQEYIPNQSKIQILNSTFSIFFRKLYGLYKYNDSLSLTEDKMKEIDKIFLSHLTLLRGLLPNEQTRQRESLAEEFILWEGRLTDNSSYEKG